MSDVLTLHHIPAHMKQFGLCLLGRAVADSSCSEMMRPFAHASAVTMAAQAAEILIKAKVSEKSPLLIFAKLPPVPHQDRELSLEDLFESAKSHMYDELPNLLWAATGLRIPNLPEYKSFGKLRNKIMHFAVPEAELTERTLSFAVSVMEPMVRDFWSESAIAYAEDYDEVIGEGYLEEQLVRFGIPIDRELQTLFSSPKS